MTTDSLIVKVIQHYHSDWEPPRDRGTEWQKALCPFHGESNPSASISFRHNAFKCHACGAGGNAITIIMREEGMSYRQAVEYAEGIAPGSDLGIPRKSGRKPGRRAFGQPGTADGSGQGGDQEVPSRVRRRSTPWS